MIMYFFCNFADEFGNAYFHINYLSTQNLTTMKRMMFLVCMFLTLGTTYAMTEKNTAVEMASDGYVVGVNQLPAAAQEVITKCFADKKILTILKERGEYEVIFQNGEKIEFNKKGEWTEVSCKMSQVPDILIPNQIKQRIMADFANARIVKIDRSSNGRNYDVELSNGLEVEFDKKFNVKKVND